MAGGPLRYGEDPKVGDLAEMRDHLPDVAVLELRSTRAAHAQADQAALLADGVLLPLPLPELRQVPGPALVEGLLPQIEAVLPRELAELELAVGVDGEGVLACAAAVDVLPSIDGVLGLQGLGAGRLQARQAI